MLGSQSTRCTCNRSPVNSYYKAKESSWEEYRYILYLGLREE